MTQRERENQFISRSKLKFGDALDYSQLVGNFVNMNTKVNIRCVKHNETFETFPNNHLKSKGGGCKSCKTEILSISRNTTGSVPKGGICSSCKNKSDKKTCDDCKQKNLERRIVREKLVDVCGKEGCKNMIKEGQTYCGRHMNVENPIVRVKEVVETKIKCELCYVKAFKDSRWCKTHEREVMLEEGKQKGIIYCSNFMKGCTSVLSSNYEKKKCESCLTADRMREKASKQMKTEIHEKQILEGSDILLCVNCNTTKPASEFVTSKGNPSKKCSECLEKQYIAEENRPKRDRSVQYKEYSSQPEVKQRKKEWKQANRDKIRQYYRDYRDRKMNEDPILYLKRNAENQKAWREANPEKHKTIQEKHESTLLCKKTQYVSKALRNGIKWMLSDEDFEIMCKSDCFYCAKITEEGELIGVDRLDSDGDYTIENCRGSCTECNMSKGGLSLKQFIAQCARITCYNNENMDDVLFLYEDIPYISKNGSSYADYSKRPKFQLTKEEFDNIVDNNCKYCSLRPPINCGIDRLDNNEGYVIDNCVPSCEVCNYMKRDQEYESFLERCEKISFNFIEKEYELPEAIRPDKWRMAPRLTQKPIALLSRTEKSIIRWNERHKIGDWAGITSRIDFGKGSNQDKKKMEELEANTKLAFEEALKEKIKLVKSQESKPKRKYEFQDPNMSDEEKEKIRKQKDKLRQQKHRDKKKEIKILVEKRTSDEQREYERKRKAEYRAKKKQKFVEKTKII